jgi:hypothetical protein
MAEGLPQRAAIDQRRLFQIRRQALEEADHHVDEDRDRDHEMRDEDRPEAAGEAQHLEHHVQRDQIAERRRDARDQDADGDAMRGGFGDAVARRHADKDRHQGRPARHQQAVDEIAYQVAVLEHGLEIRQRRRAREEDRRVGHVVDLVLQRERQHPEQHQDRRRDDHEDREGEGELRQRALRVPEDIGR